MPVKKTTRGTRTAELDVLPAGSTPELSLAEERQPADTFDDVARRLQEREGGLTPARKAAQDRREKEVVEGAAAHTVESAIKGMANLKVSLDSTLDRLAESIVGEAKKFTQLREATKALEHRIAEMHDIEIVADSLATLVRDHEEHARAFDAEKSEARAAWEKEKQAWHEAFEAGKAKAQREWQREQEEQDYALKTRRAREDAERKSSRAVEDEARTAEHARREKVLAEREAAVTTHETELSDLRARVAGFQTEMDKAVQKARGDAIVATEEKARHEADLRTLTLDSEAKLLKQRIQTLETTIKEQASRIGEYQAELKEAMDKVRDIAVKAIDGASGAAALSRVNEIAMQQAKTRADG